MEDEIFDMEQVLGMDDSFCVNDNDVLKILKTWRLTTGNEGAEEQQTAAQQQLVSSSKFIDSRTFTRPKKKLMQYPDYNFPSSANHLQDPSPNRAGLNLQIGGAYTNPLSSSMMQRSLITDVSPPNSLASSLSYNECGNSLITSGDFSNITCLLNNQEDDLRSNGLTRQSLGSVSERNSKFSSNLLDDSKDNNILKTDMHGIDEQMSSGNSTLQNSMEFTSNGSELRAKNNDTFITKNGTFKLDTPGNVTFDTSGGPVLNQTYDQVSGSSPKTNDTFVKASTATPDKLPGNSTVILNNAEFDSPLLERSIPPIPVQSTPSLHQSRLQKFSDTIVVEDLSPITTQPTTTLRRNKGRLTVEQDDDNKRISLQNFEDVEKSISLLENTQDEAGFDVILEDITDLKRSLDANEKFKQSLQNIKNRHSQANLERQQEEMFRKKFDATMTFDNKLMDSMNKSMSSSGGSERLLNRRSRLDDGVGLVTQEIDINQPTNNESPKTTLVVEGNAGNPDRKANRDRFKTMRITKKHIEGMIVIDGEEREQNEYDEAEEISRDPNIEMINGTYVHINDRNTGDKQEEINDEDEPLFKKPVIPQKPLNGVPFRARSLSKPKYYSGLYGDRKASLQLQLVGKASSIDHLDSNRIMTNSQENINTTMTIGKSGVNSKQQPGSNLKSPMGAKSKSYHNLVYTSGTSNQMSGIKPLTSAPKYVSRYGQAAMRAPPSNKISGIEPLKKTNFANNQQQQQSQQLPGKQFVKQSLTTNTRQLKPSGFRAPASVSNNNNLTKEASRTYGSSQGLAKPLSLNKTGNIRPSSGFHSYNNTNVSNNNFRNKGNNDSDPDSERYSPNSLCSSSASSRGSLHPSEAQSSTHKMLNSVEDIDSIGSETTVIKQMPPPSRLARPSGLKQPTAVRSGLPRPTNFTKR